ncbi:MAG: lipopolysaccharide biosynthesis protein [Planctomycetota bacterium]
MTLKAQVLSALRWTAAARLGAQLITWAITIFVIRVLSDADYGLMGLAEVLIVFVTLINELGAIPALMQMKSIDDRVVRQVHGLVLLSNVVLAAIVFAIAPWFAAFFGREELILVTRVLALQPLIGALAATPAALLKRELQFKGLSIIEFVAMVASAVTSLALALAGFAVWALVLGSLLNVSIRTAGILWVSRLGIRPSFRFGGLGQVMRFGARISAQRILWHFQTQVDMLLVGKLLSVSSAGVYKVALNLALLPMNKAMGLLKQIALPAYARIQDDADKARYYFFRSAEVASLFFFPLLWGLSVVSEDFVQACLGRRWEGAIVVLQILALVVPFRVLSQLTTPMLEGLGRPDISLRNLMTSAVLVPIGVVLGLYSGFGLAGVCTGVVSAYLLSIPINARRTLPTIGTNLAQVARPLVPTVLSAMLMYGGVMVAQQFLLVGLTPAWRLVAGVLIGACVFLVSILSLNQKTVASAVQLLRS